MPTRGNIPRNTSSSLLHQERRASACSWHLALWLASAIYRVALHLASIALTFPSIDLAFPSVALTVSCHLSRCLPHLSHSLLAIYGFEFHLPSIALPFSWHLSLWRSHLSLWLSHLSGDTTTCRMAGVTLHSPSARIYGFGFPAASLSCAASAESLFSISLAACVKVRGYQKRLQGYLNKKTHPPMTLPWAYA